MRHRPVSLLVLMFFALSLPLAGDVCKLEDTVEECRARVPRAEMAKQLANKNAGYSPAVGGSALDDFLSFMRVSADSGGGAGSSDGETLAIELNRFLGLPIGHGYRFQVVAHKAKLFKPIEEKLAKEITEDVLNDRIAALKKDLDDFGDLSFSFSFSPTNKTHGREPKRYQDEWSSLLAAVKEQTVQSLASAVEAIDKVEAFLQHHLSRIPPDLFDDNGNFTGRFEQIPDPDIARQFKLLIENEERVMMARQTELESKLRETDFFHFIDLINNQPQFHVKFETTARDELVGPDEISATVSYEVGSVNVNAYRRECGEDTDTIRCYRRFLNPKRLTRLKRGNRLKFSVEYSDIDDYHLEFPDDGVTLDIAGDRKIVGSLTYGRYLEFDETGEGRSRIDLEVSYQNFGDDPNRQDRALANLTYSRRLVEDLVFSTGLVYANKPEFLGEVDQEVSARLGFNYKISRNKEF